MASAANGLPAASPASQVYLSNAILGGVRGGLFVLNTLLLMRVLLDRLGAEEFAVFVMAYPFLRFGFSGAFDPGLTVALSRRVSVAWAEGDAAGINQEFSASVLLFTLALPLALVVAGAISRPLVNLLLPGSNPLRVQAVGFFEASAIAYCIMAAGNPFWGVLIGLQRMAASHLLGIVALLFELVAILCLHRHLSLVVLPWIYGAEGLVCLVAGVILARRAFPALRLVRLVHWRQRARGLLSFSGRMSVTVVTSTLGPVLDKAILGSTLGIAVVVSYEAASRLVEVARRVSQLMMTPVLPMAGYRQNLEPQANQLHYEKLFGANFILSCSLYLLPLGLAPMVFELWLGHADRLATIIFACAALSVFCISAAGPAIYTWAGRNRLGPVIQTSAIGLIINLTVTPLLTVHYGLGGFLAGMLLGYGAVNLAALLILSHGATTPTFLAPRRVLVLAGGSLGVAVLLAAVLDRLRVLLGTGLLHLTYLALAGLVAYTSLIAILPGVRTLLTEIARKILKTPRAGCVEGGA